MTKATQDQREAFCSHQAKELAEVAGGPGLTQITVGTDGRKLTTKACWFARAGRLVAVAGPDGSSEETDLALAYGLHHAADDDLLVLVIPKDETASRAIMVRAPFLHRALEIWTYDLTSLREGSESRPEEHPIWSPSEIFTKYRDPASWNYGIQAPSRPSDHREFLGVRSAWVERLTAWAESDEDLDPGHTNKYLAWTCRGKRVLSIGKPGRGLVVKAGIHYGGPDRSPHREDLSGPLSAAAAHQLVGRASLAAAELLDGFDGRYPESALQAAIARKTPTELGITGGLSREHPAWRPYVRPIESRSNAKGRGSLDFLGVNITGGFEIVETKVGPDEMLVLQGLDYWIWVMANGKRLGPTFGISVRASAATINFVVSRRGSGRPLSPYSKRQSAAISKKIGQRFWEATGWSSGHDPDVSLHRINLL